MKKKLTTCAVIPARSGSKIVKDKNIIKLNGHPIMSYSISIAKKSTQIDKVVFSSDSKKYLNIAKKYKPDIIHKRSKKNSSDKATDLDFLKEIIKYLFNNHNYKPDLIVLLRGNCPSRNLKNLDKAIKYFKQNMKKYTSLRSVTKMSETSYKTFYISSKKLKNIVTKNYDEKNSNKPKEAFKETYSGNGYIDIIKTKSIQENFMHGHKVLAYENEDICVDIDYPQDLVYAKFLLNNYKYFRIK
tara:strand:- start:64 stop:792 length:729 start_codon:yes stop_codon:yes gene_type:complete